MRAGSLMHNAVSMCWACHGLMSNLLQALVVALGGSSVHCGEFTASKGTMLKSIDDFGQN